MGEIETDAVIEVTVSSDETAKPVPMEAVRDLQIRLEVTIAEWGEDHNLTTFLRAVEYDDNNEKEVTH